MKRRLRIAIFEISRIYWGGGQKELANTAAHLSLKHDVTIFTQKNPDKNLDFGKCKIKLIKPHNRFLAPFAFLLHKLNKKNFDLILTGGFPSNLSVFRNSKLPSIHISHSPPRFFYDLKYHFMSVGTFKEKMVVRVKNILFKRLEYLAAQKNDGILAISEEIKKRVKDCYGRDDAVVFYPGVDPRKYSMGDYGKYILSVTRMVSTKRPMVLAEAMKYVKNRDIKMVFVGAGPFKEKVEKLSKKNKNIIVKGFVSESELKDLYANCLAAIYIPINEDYGYAPVEAGMSGKATIGSDEGGLKETIVDGKTGFLIKDVDARKVAEKIDIFAEDKKLAIKMGKAARRYCKKFELLNTFKVLEDMIEKVVEKRK